MGIISKMRKQNAIYWPPTGQDDFGKPTVGAAVELTLAAGVNSRVRWEGKNEEFQDNAGTMHMSNAVVYVPILPSGGGEVLVGGFLWLGDVADLTDAATPALNEGAWEIKRVDKLPNLKNSEYLRTSYL